MLPSHRALNADTLVHERYLIIRPIGKGGMGAVYEAVDQRLGNTVALKQTLFSEEQLNRAFEREARLLASLRHPALPVVSDYFANDDGQFLVMQFIPGKDLGALLDERGAPFGLDEVLRWADQLLAALDFLHTQPQPIIHRDIKPQNMKLTPRDEIILLDFGLAKGTLIQTRATNSGSIFGYTPRYAPMEQVRGTGTDPRSDLYSLAATLYHMLTNVAPTDALDRASAALDGQPDPLRPAHELNPRLPAAVSDVLQRALALRPDERPATAAAMRALLRAAPLGALPPALPPRAPVKASTGTTVVLGATTLPDPAALPSAGAPVPSPLPTTAPRRAWLVPIVGCGVVLLALIVLVGFGTSRLLSAVGDVFANPTVSAALATAAHSDTAATVMVAVQTAAIEERPSAQVQPRPTRAPRQEQATPTADDARTPSPAARAALLTFGGEGTGAGLFQDARTIAVDGAGFLYVADYETGRVQRFASDGSYQSTWTVVARNPIILALAADQQGRVYAVVAGDVLQYEGATGKLLGTFTPADNGSCNDVTTLATGQIVCHATPIFDGLIYFDPSGKELRRVAGIVSEQNDGPDLTARVAVDGLGTVFVIAGSSKTVYKYTSAGKFIDRFDVPNAWAFSAIAVDNQSRVYVSQFGSGIAVFDAEGHALTTLATPGAAKGIAISRTNALYITTGTQGFELALPAAQ